jgi:hypothetical protein
MAVLANTRQLPDPRVPTLVQSARERGSPGVVSCLFPWLAPRALQATSMQARARRYRPRRGL